MTFVKFSVISVIYKGHFDQNEKIGQDYGCSHVLMIDAVPG